MKDNIIRTYDDFLESRYSFFILNTVGWFLYWIFRLLIVSSVLDFTPKLLMNTSIAIFSGYLTTFILHYFYKRINFSPTPDLKVLTSVFILSMIHSVVWFFVDFVIYSQIMLPFEKLIQWLNLRVFMQQFFLNLLILLIWSSVYYIFKMRENWKQLEQRKIQSELHAKNLEIQMLRYQLNPHFLFNSLNSIRSLALKDTTRTREMISELSEFLKYSLINKNNSNVAVKSEMEAVQHFCNIEKIRFREKLNIHFNISYNTEEVLIPSLILHPLVENAIKYGMETAPLPLTVEINSFINDGKLFIEIINDGIWIEEGSEKKTELQGTNTGIKNVKQILKNTFDEKQSFDIIKKNDQVIVRVAIKLNGIN